MKSLCASVAVIVVALVSSANAGAPGPASPQAPAQSASVPAIVRLDGQLRTPTGEPRTGTVLLVVSLYADREDSTPLWVEHQAVTIDAGGRYTVFAGATLADGLPKELFAANTARWVGVGVQGEAEQPRIMLLSVPYAVKAGEADTLTGKTASDFVLTEQLTDSVKSTLKAEGVKTNEVSADGPTPGLVSTTNAIAKFTDTIGTIGDSNIYNVSGNVGIGTTGPNARLEVAPISNGSAAIRVPFAAGNGNYLQAGYKFIDSVGGNDLQLRTEGSTWLTVRSTTGNVGIGTTGPVAALDVRSVVSIGANAADVGSLRFPNNTTIRFRNAAGTGNVQAFEVDATNRINIGPDWMTLTAGNVGIGTTSPGSKLDVNGSINVTGNINAKYQDVAEWVETPEPLEAGTVVIVDPLETNRVLPAPRAYDTRVAGAVSRQPGLILGERGDTKAMIAQSGRVRVKVDAKYGAIRIGDLLVTSPTPGYAMRSQPIKVGGQSLHRPGTLLGKALEALPNGKGEILVLLTLQ